MTMKVVKTSAPRGPKPRRVFINVKVRATSRDTLSRLRHQLGLGSQGEVIDSLLARYRDYNKGS